jgi:LCCL domain
MKVVHELVTYFDRKGRLSARQLRKLLDDNQIAGDAPTNMHAHCDVIDAVFYFRVTGVGEGQVWGTDTYTRDSVLGVAAVHAGLIKPGKTRVLRVTVVPALKSYHGTTRNGVTTSDYAEYPHAWVLSAI